MKDPYQVLGIDRSASEEEIKRAYRKLSRLYHPDSNINNPNKEQAAEKFREVQQAYERIMSGQAGEADVSPFGYSAYGEPTHTAQTETDRNSMYYQAAANYIRSRMYQEAINTLKGIREADRDARWYYYSAMTNAGLKRHATALSHIQKAIELDPGNFQYELFRTRLQTGGDWYEDRQNAYHMPQEGLSFGFKLCLTLICCNSCGGGCLYFCAPNPFFY